MNIIREFNKDLIKEAYNIDTTRKKKVIAVDLDGTLAYYKKGRIDIIGDPIPEMYNRVKNWLTIGDEVRILTARVANDSTQIVKIKHWLKKHGLPDLEVTCIKTPDIDEIWDDKAVSVIFNTGVIR
ncbi:MAG: hypothetical protein ACOCQD_00495 [archaeon]